MIAPERPEPGRDPVEDDHGHAGLDEPLERRARPLLSGEHDEDGVGPCLAQEAIHRLGLGPGRAPGELRVEEPDASAVQGRARLAHEELP